MLRMLHPILSHIQGGTLDIVWPSGVTTQHGSGSPAVTLSLHNFKPFFSLLRTGHIGFAESYLRGDWSSNDLLEFFLLVHRNESSFENDLSGSGIARWLNKLAHGFKRNSRAGSQKNIAYHYDLGNDFYRLWLDPSMTYSSGIYPSTTSALIDAQAHKLDTISQWLAPTADSHVLEIGCGWGALSQKLATEHRCKVTGISLSQAQLSYAKEKWGKQSRISDPTASQILEPATDHEQCDDAIEYRYVDYRDVQGKFDHIVSIEMFEAVGMAYWSAYFQKLSDLLRVDGTVLLQVITIEEAHFDNYRQNPDFIQRYIFPGGMLPTKSVLTELGEKSGFKVATQTWFGQSYSRTLASWRKRFEQRITEVQQLGYDDRFIRMWRYYLAYCEAGFSLGTTDVGLIKLKKVSD